LGFHRGRKFLQQLNDFQFLEAERPGTEVGVALLGQHEYPINSGVVLKKKTLVYVSRAFTALEIFVSVHNDLQFDVTPRT
jgi:hypothetical protein